VRICGDFRVKIYLVSKLNKYHIPKVGDLFVTLKRGKTFTKLDFSQVATPGLGVKKVRGDHTQSLIPLPLLAFQYFLCPRYLPTGNGEPVTRDSWRHRVLR